MCQHSKTHKLHGTLRLAYANSGYLHPSERAVVVSAALDVFGGFLDINEVAFPKERQRGESAVREASIDFSPLG